MIKWSNLSYTYGVDNLKFPDFEANPSDQFLILGESGSGKTTLLHLIGGLLKPKSGIIIINGQTLNQLSEAKLDKFRGKNIGIVFQQAHFIQSISVLENVIFAITISGKKPDTNRAKNILNELGLSNKIHKKPSHLSIGQQQRVSIARAIFNKPKLIIADEPTAALDDFNCNIVINLLKEQVAKVGATLLIVTHDNRLKTKFPNQLNIEKNA